MALIAGRFVRNVVSLDAEASCAEAARVMAAAGIGSVGVLREGRLVGLVTERDVVAQLAAGAAPDRTTVGEVLRTDRPAVSPRTTDRDCAVLMRRHRTRHLAVEEGGEVVGVVSMLDLVDLVVEEGQWRIDQLESYIGGGRCRQLSEPISTPFGHAGAPAGSPG